jgi:hypothetical protein
VLRPCAKATNRGGQWERKVLSLRMLERLFLTLAKVAHGGAAKVSVRRSVSSSVFTALSGGGISGCIFSITPALVRDVHVSYWVLPGCCYCALVNAKVGTRLITNFNESNITKSNGSQPLSDSANRHQSTLLYDTMIYLTRAYGAMHSPASLTL